MNSTGDGHLRSVKEEVKEEQDEDMSSSSDDTGVGSHARARRARVILRANKNKMPKG